MRKYTELRETNNSYIYNKLHKLYLESRKKISCTYCRYHHGENDTKGWYGTKFHSDDKGSLRYPSWKLSSKIKRQWGAKNLKFEAVYRIFHSTYIKITF